MDFKLARFNMVEQQIRPWKIFDPVLLELLNQIPREKFVDDEYQSIAYADLELPLLGGGKSPSPQIVAHLIQALEIKPTDKVLEIGTNCGYATSVLAKMADFVYSIEANYHNHKLAVNNLSRLGIKNVCLINSNGEQGLITHAPFDKILINIKLDNLTDEFKKQLKPHGKITAILGNSIPMELVMIDKLSEVDYKTTQILETMQLPLVTNLRPITFNF